MPESVTLSLGLRDLYVTVSVPDHNTRLPALQPPTLPNPSKPSSCGVPLVGQGTLTLALDWLGEANPVIPT